MAVIVSNNRQLIPTPGPGQRRYGLFDAVASSQEADARMIGAGLQFLQDGCGNEVEEYEQTCSVNPVKPFTEGSDLVGTLPFWLVTRKRCGGAGRTAEEMRAAVRRQMDTGAQTRVEDIFWDGNGLAGVFNLAASTPVVVTSPAPGAGTAISALESAFYAEFGYVGTIHLNTVAEGALAYSQMLVRQGGAGQLRTPIGSVVSLGAGYDITGPAGEVPDAGFVWAYMTAPVHMWWVEIGQPDPRQVFDRTLNQWDVVAERVYALVPECETTFAIQVPIAAPAVATAPAVPAP